jgi:hypothetical protein
MDAVGQPVNRNGTAAADEKTKWKQFFLDRMFLLQMQWASSTASEKSFVHSSFYGDRRLRALLQRFPDSFYVLYRPVIQFEKTQIELEALLLTPSSLVCLAYANGKDGAVYVGSSSHFWPNAANGEDKLLNPLLSANRMHTIVSRIFKEHLINLPVQRAIIAENSFIDYPDVPHDVLLIDKRRYESWLKALRAMPSPVKRMQILGAKALLASCQSQSIKRGHFGKM